jgi:hypothetical protein
MIRPLLLAALAALQLAPAQVAAQTAPFVTVQCSDNLRGLGRRAVRVTAAIDSAIEAYDGEARRRHGARTPFSFRMGEAFSNRRLNLTCTRQSGMHLCEVSGRTCAWVTTATPNTTVASRCPEGRTFITERGGCGITQRNESSGSGSPFIVRMPDVVHLPDCPSGYMLDGSEVTRCRRS